MRNGELKADREAPIETLVTESQVLMRLPRMFRHMPDDLLRMFLGIDPVRVAETSRQLPMPVTRIFWGIARVKLPRP